MIICLIGIPAYASRPSGAFEVGGRLGVFTNNETSLDRTDSGVELFGSRTNVYAEFTGGFYPLPYLGLIANLGSYSKGDIRFEGFQEGIGRRTFFGNAAIYAMQLGLRLTPFGDQLPAGMQPYLEGGGALLIGTESIDALYYDVFQSAWVDGNLETETDINWWAGFGIGFPLSRQFTLDFMGKYINTDFSDDIAGITDYSGWQLSVGVGYLILTK
jgi:hypothetical protein